MADETYVPVVDQLDIDVVKRAVANKQKAGVEGRMNVRYEILAELGALDTLVSRKHDVERYEKMPVDQRKLMFVVADVKKLHDLLFSE